MSNESKVKTKQNETRENFLKSGKGKGINKN